MSSPTTYTIPMPRNTGNDGYRSAHILRFGRGRFSIHALGPQDSGRKSHGGPMVPGPWAFAVPQATVIDNHGGTGAEARRGEAAGTEYPVAVGDTLVLRGESYRVYRRGGLCGDFTMGLELLDDCPDQPDPAVADDGEVLLLMGG